VVTLVILVALTFASLGLLRSVDTGNLLAGNLSFRQDASSQADFGLRIAAQAAATIVGTSAESVDAPPYYASVQTSDTRGIPLLLANAASPSIPGTSVATPGVGQQAIPLGTPGGGILIRYVLERTCPTSGAATSTDDCRTFLPPGLLSRSLGVRELPPPPTPYVRATVRIDGPNNVVSFVQAMVR
jgi:hypothetical protein